MSLSRIFRCARPSAASPRAGWASPLEPDQKCRRRQRPCLPTMRSWSRCSTPYGSSPNKNRTFERQSPAQRSGFCCRDTRRGDYFFFLEVFFATFLVAAFAVFFAFFAFFAFLAMSSSVETFARCTCACRVSTCTALRPYLNCKIDTSPSEATATDDDRPPVVIQVSVVVACLRASTTARHRSK
jgi:hypothetical protein